MSVFKMTQATVLLTESLYANFLANFTVLSLQDQTVLKIRPFQNFSSANIYTSLLFHSSDNGETNKENFVNFNKFRTTRCLREVDFFHES